MMVQLTATVEDVLSWELCGDWTEDRIRAIAGEKIEWTAIDILSLEGISAFDKLWLILRPELISEPILHELGCRFAEAALHAEDASGEEVDCRSWAAIEVKRAWLRGEIDDAGLGAACEAAWAAMREVDVVWVAACAAAWAAEVPRSRAGEPTWEAAWAARAARTAVAAAAADVEIECLAERQVEMVREILLA